LLVVPSFAKDPALPEGIWERLNLVDGDESDPYQAKLFIKGGSIIPAGKIIQNTNEKSIDQLTLFICLDSQGKASGELYWDAGEGWGFKNGDYSLLRFQATEKNGVTKINLTSRRGRYNINKDIHQVKAVVVKNGQVYSGLINLKNGELKTMRS
jgi:alpha-glucosidase